MTDFPQRPDKHVSEDVSIRVFQECLPAHWIFRDQGTRNDYGVDGEVELVTNAGELQGHIAKVQLKGRATVVANDDGSISVGGIKQTTLRYWIGLSRYANVIAAVTDNAAHEAYFASVFWQATELLDGGETTKTIRFRKECRLKSDVGPALFALMTLDRPWETIRAHEELLRMMPAVLHDYLWVFQADAWSIHDPSDITQRWLKNGRAVLGATLREEDQASFDFAAWCAESERTWKDSPMRGTMRKTYAKTFPLVFLRMRKLSERVLKGRYYWSREAPEYLELVEATVLPVAYDWEAISRFVDEHKIPEPR